jgi:hypothetical protein
MKRREFIALLGGAAVAWPLTVRAQQPHVPVVGVLRPNRQDVLETFAEPFRRYMKAIGWEEGRNIRRWRRRLESSRSMARGPERWSSRGSLRSKALALNG